MANRYAPLGEAEISLAEKKLSQYVTKLNTVFSSRGLPLLDEEASLASLRAKIEDENLVARYRLANELKSRDEAQSNLLKELSESKKLPDDRNYLSKSFQFLLRVDPSKGEYNKALYEAYQTNPEEFAHWRIKTLLEFDATEAYEAGDDEVALLEFYKAHADICHEAGSFSDILSHKALGVSKELQSASASLSGLIESLDVSYLIDSSSDIDLFAFPDLTKEQMDVVAKNPEIVFGSSAPKPHFDRQLGTHIPSFKKKVDQCKDIGVSFSGKGFFTKYKAAIGNKEISLLDAAKSKESATISTRSKREVAKILDGTKAFQSRYASTFAKRVGEKQGEAYEFARVSAEMRGNFFDRLLHKPIPEFDEFLQSLSDYNDPASPHYLDKDALKRKGANYLSSAKEKGVAEEKMSLIDKRRTSLVRNVMRTIAEMEKDDAKIRASIETDIESRIPSLSFDRTPVFESALELEQDDFDLTSSLEDPADLEKEEYLDEDELEQNNV